MVKIRLARLGTKNQPKYRIVVADEARARSGRFIEIIGTVDATGKSKKVDFNKERYQYWVSVGAQTSVAVEELVS